MPTMLRGCAGCGSKTMRGAEDLSIVDYATALLCNATSEGSLGWAHKGPLDNTFVDLVAETQKQAGITPINGCINLATLTYIVAAQKAGRKTPVGDRVVFSGQDINGRPITLDLPAEGIPSYVWIGGAALAGAIGYLVYREKKGRK